MLADKFAQGFVGWAVFGVVQALVAFKFWVVVVRHQLLGGFACNNGLALGFSLVDQRCALGLFLGVIADRVNAQVFAVVIVTGKQVGVCRGVLGAGGACAGYGVQTGAGGVKRWLD